METEVIVSALVEQLLPYVVPVLGGIATLLGTWVLTRLGQLLGVQRQAADALCWKELVDGGIAYAEKKAANWHLSTNAPIPAGRKLLWAMTWIQEEARERGIRAPAPERVSEWIESRLGDPRAPG